jgi:CHAT domain-containing protein/tetratricopeptide (TPR) repeat protein
MLRLLGIILVGGLLWGQFFPYENVFGQGDIKGFAKKAEKAYRSALKGSSPSSPLLIRAACARALALAALGKAREADSLLAQYVTGSLDKEVAFLYYWVRAYVANQLGAAPAAADYIQKARAVGQEPWQTNLIALEEARLLIYLGQISTARRVLREAAPSPLLQTPLLPYIQETYRHLLYLLYWEEGNWDSLPARYPPSKARFHAAQSAADLHYYRGLAFAFQGANTLALREAKKSASYAKKLADLAEVYRFRAQAFATFLQIARTNRGNYQKRIRLLSPLISATTKQKDRTLSEPFVQGLEHVVEASLLIRKYSLAENIISYYMGQQPSTLWAQRLYGIATQIALRQGRGNIALNFATQASNLSLRAGLDTTLEGAQTLTHLVEAAQAQYQYSLADSMAEKILRTLAQQGEPLLPRLIPIREKISRRSIQRGLYARAETLMTYQLNTLNKLLPQPEKSLAYLRAGLLLADLQLRLAQVSRVDTLLRRIRKPIEDLPLPYVREKIALYELSGDLESLRGQYKEAERYYSEAARLRSRLSKEEALNEESYSLLRLARLYQRTGRLNQAREIYQKIAKLYQLSGRKDPEVAAFYVDLVSFYILSGDYLKAQQTAEEALRLAREVQGEGSAGYVEALLSAAAVEEALGRYDNQNRYLLSAAESQKRFYGGKPALALARTYLKLAQNNLFRNYPDSVRFYLEKAFSEADQAQNTAPLEYASLNLDAIPLLLYLGQTAKADERLQTARTLLEAQLNLRHPERIRLYLLSARVNKAKGENLKALAEYKRFITLWKALYGEKHPEYPFYLGEMADYYWAAQDYSSTKKTYEKSAQLILDQVDKIFTGLSEADKTRYWARIRSILEKYYAYAFYTGVPGIQEKAYNVYLATKALILSETAQLRRRLEKSSDTTIARVYREWQEQKDYVTRLYTYTAQELSELGVNLAQEEARLNALERELTALVGDIRLARPSWKDIRTKLQDGTVTIDWVRTRVPNTDSIVYYAVLITPKAKKPIVVPFSEGKKMEEYYLFRYSQSILNFERDTTSYRAYWAPIAAQLPPDTKTLLVSNDGVFNQVNLSTIALPEGGYLVDKYQIIYHSRLASLAKPPKPLKYYEGRKAWIVADPDYNGGLPPDSVYVPDLPGTAQEAQAVQALFQSAGILPYVYTRREASELRSKQARSPYILHIATHGVFLPYDERIGELIGIQSSSALANPLFRSALLLADAGKTMIRGEAPDPENDGFLNAYEMLGLSLDNTEVVTLSACETGVGEVQNGEGVYGLQRALLIAGARNLILSLWRVDDEATRDFMVTFYRQWLVVRLPMAEAFWTAQKEMRKARPQPYFWGAFVLVRP